jgi:thiamine-monophosphate kinase
MERKGRGIAVIDTRSAEDRLIAELFAPLATHPGALGLTDDAAFVTPEPGTDLVLTTDAVVAGVHFFPEDDARDVAKKALRVNLSDLAAKGATPRGFLVSLAIAADTGLVWLRSFAEGLRADIETYACPLLGGDTDRTPGPLSVSIFLLGSVPNGTMVRRRGAKPGDRIFVTGTIGDAALGLQLRKGANWKLTEAQREHLLSRYRLPRSRTALAEAIRTHASAGIDVSDGLVGDLTKLCRVSGVAARVEVARVPLSDAARAVIRLDPAMREVALTGGDDYEILCTVPLDRVTSFRTVAQAAEVEVTEVGEIASGQGARFVDADGQTLTFGKLAFSHF